MLTVTAPVGQPAAQGPQYQHSSTCINALPVAGLMARESSGQMSTHSVQPSMHRDASMVTGTSALFSTRGTQDSCPRGGWVSVGGPPWVATGIGRAGRAGLCLKSTSPIGKMEYRVPRLRMRGGCCGCRSGRHSRHLRHSARFALVVSGALAPQIANGNLDTKRVCLMLPLTATSHPAGDCLS